MHNRVAVLLVPAAAVLLVACGSSERPSSGSAAIVAPATSQPSSAAAPTTPASSTHAPATSDDTAASDVPASGDVQEIMINVEDPTQVGKSYAIKLGTTVVLRLLSDTDQEYHVQGYDLQQKSAAGVEASFEFTADQAGAFAVESVTTNKVLATLKVA